MKVRNREIRRERSREALVMCGRSARSRCREAAIEVYITASSANVAGKKLKKKNIARKRVMSAHNKYVSDKGAQK